MFAGQIKIVQLLLLYCIVVQSYILHDDRLTQAELKSKETTTNTNNDFWWFVKPSGIYEFITEIFKWTFDVLTSTWRAISARSFGDKSSFSGIQPPPKSQPLTNQSPLPANNGPIDQENTSEILKHVKSMLTQLKPISKETTSDDGSSEILFVKQPTYFSFQIFQLVSLVYWWGNDVLMSRTVDKKSFNESPQEHQSSLPAKESNDESKNLLMNATDVSKREARSMLTQIKAKSSVSEETTKDAKSYSHMPCSSWLSQSHRLQSMIDLWLDDVATSNTINKIYNKSSQHPLESQPPSAKENNTENNNKLKDRKRISRFFRIYELTDMLKRWFDDTFLPNTIVKNKQVVFQPSLKSRSSFPTKENDDRLKVREKIIADVLENVKSRFIKEKPKRTITNADDISSSILFRRPEHDNIQMFKLVSIVYWWVYDTLKLNTGKKSSNEPPLESQFSLPAKEIDKGPKDQEINIADNLKRESVQTELKLKVSEETTTKTMLKRHAVNVEADIERLPEEEIDPDFLDALDDLTSLFNSKNFQKTELNLYNAMRISTKSNHFTVSPIVTSSNSYQIVENNSISKTPDMFEYPASVHNSTVPPIITVTYIASNMMYVHPKSNATLTRVFGESFDHFTESSIATSPDNYYQTEKNTPETHNVSNDEVSNDKADNDDPSIHKTVNFHKNDGNSKTFKLKDDVKQSNKVEIYSDYSRVRYYSNHRIFLPFN